MWHSIWNYLTLSNDLLKVKPKPNIQFANLLNSEIHFPTCHDKFIGHFKSVILYNTPLIYGPYSKKVKGYEGILGS